MTRRRERRHGKLKTGREAGKWRHKQAGQQQGLDQETGSKTIRRARDREYCKRIVNKRQAERLQRAKDREYCKRTRKKDRQKDYRE